MGDHLALIMSWDAYVTDQIIGSGCATAGCILGKEDGSPWAQSSEDISAGGADLAKWAASDDPEAPHATLPNGVTFMGKKWMILKGDTDDDIPTLCLKSGKEGAFACVTEQAIVLGVHDEKIQGGSCRSAVFNLAKYLKDNSY